MQPRFAKYLFLVAALFCCAFIPVMAHATTFTYEDTGQGGIPGVDIVYTLSYALTGTTLDVTLTVDNKVASNNNFIVEPEFKLFNDTPVVGTSAFLTSPTSDWSIVNPQDHFWGALALTSTGINLADIGTTTFTFEFTGISHLIYPPTLPSIHVVYSPHGTLSDDFQLSTSVPEPATMLLLSLGLLGLAASRKRPKKAC